MVLQYRSFPSLNTKNVALKQSPSIIPAVEYKILSPRSYFIVIALVFVQEFKS